MSRLSLRAVTACVFMIVVQTASAEAPMAPELSLNQANQLLSVALETARRLEAPGGTMVVVDRAGELIAGQRLDGSFSASATVALGKARTAALFQKPTSALEQTINSGRAALLALTAHGYTPLQGGVPLQMNGRFVGAIGVSGAASAAQDEQIAQAAAASLGNVRE